MLSPETLLPGQAPYYFLPELMMRFQITIFLLISCALQSVVLGQDRGRRRGGGGENMPKVGSLVPDISVFDGLDGTEVEDGRLDSGIVRHGDDVRVRVERYLVVAVEGRIFFVCDFDASVTKGVHPSDF